MTYIYKLHTLKTTDSYSIADKDEIAVWGKVFLNQIEDSLQKVIEVATTGPDLD